MPKCPRDKGLDYNIKFCREFAKGKYRPWCKDCEYIKKIKENKK